MKCPREQDHDLIRRRLGPCTLVGSHEDAVERYELVNCPHCSTTLARPFEDAKHADESGKTLCGAPHEGSQLVKLASDVDCPLCQAIVEGAMSYPWCLSPAECILRGHCVRKPNCGD